MNNFNITNQNLLNFALAFVPALFGIVCHEVAHGWAAWKQGDPTAKALGRLTLNPIKHLDVTGTAVFALSALFSPIVIGWAKPVPVNARHFKDPRRGMLLVSLAGPAANFAVAFFCAFVAWALFMLVLKGIIPPSHTLSLVMRSAQLGVFINCTLAFFNLMPIPPLDGSHVVSSLLPREAAIRYESIGRYGMIILIVLLATRVLSKVLAPLVQNTALFILNIFF